jgi:uncharacterized protein YdaU (DUF1376 family)
MSRAWMPLYIADYLADTTHLDCAESGAYLHLIMHYWQHGGLPEDDEKCRRIAKAMPSHWRRIRPVLAQFFDSNWRHKRIDFELNKSKSYSAQQSENASKRWGIGNANACANRHAESMPARASSQSQSHKDSLNGERQEKENGKVYVKQHTKAGEAWSEWTRGKTGHGQLWDKQGGWWFPTEWPPTLSVQPMKGTP